MLSSFRVYTASSFVYLEMGEAVITGDSWRIVVDINVTRIEANLWDLLAAVGSQVELARTTGSAQGLEFLEPELNRIHSLAEEAQEAVGVLKSFLPEGKGKRGLLDIGGTIVKYIFGNPDAEDHRELVDTVALLATREEESLHVVQEQLTFTRQAVRGVEEAGKRTANLAIAVKKGFVEAGVQLADLGRNVSHLKTQLSLMGTFSSSLRCLGLSLMEFLLKLRKIQKGVEEVIDGKFSRDLVTPGELEVVLAEVDGALPTGLAFLTLEGRLHSQVYYAAASVQVAATETGVIALVDLPLTSPEQQMQLYEVVPHPVREEQTGRMVVAKPEGRYLLVNELQGTYAILQERDFNRCRRSQVWICPADVPIYHATVPSCVFANYRKDAEKTRTSCRWDLAVYGASSVWIWDESWRAWHYSIDRGTRLHIQCRDDGGLRATEEVVSGAGVLTIPAGCTAWTPEYRLLPTDVRGESKHSLTWVWVNVSRTEPVALQDEGSPTGLHILQELEELEEEIKKEKRPTQDDVWIAWESLRQAVRDRRRRTILAWSFGTGTTVFLGVVLGAACWIAKKTTRHTPPSAQGTPSSGTDRRIRIFHTTDVVPGNDACE